MKINITFFQCILCVFLLFTCILIGQRKKECAYAVGSFGNTAVFNNTFEDLTCSIYKDVFCD